MAKVSIKNIVPGMIVAKDVVDRNGRVIIGAGVEIKEAHIKAMKTWGVALVNIQNSDGENDDEESENGADDEIVLAAKSQLDKTFQFNNKDNEFVAALYEQCLETKIKESNNGDD